MERTVCTLLSAARSRSAGPGRVPFRRYCPALEQLECRNLLSTWIPLDGSGSGSSAGTLPDEFDFRATVTGRISVLMQAEQEFLQSQLTVVGTPVTDTAFLSSQVLGSLDHVVQFEVQAGQTYQFTAVAFDPGNPSAQGPYRLYITTETSDFSATTPHRIALDPSGLGVQMGTLETAGDVDLFAFKASVTGRATVRLDGGGLAGQEFRFDTRPGQTFGVQVFDPDNQTGVYVLTVTAIADDFPDSKVNTILLNRKGASRQAGRINYSDDVDVFRFRATKTGVMTLKMQNQPFTSDFAISTLRSELSVSPAKRTYAISPSVRSLKSAPASDRILQFHVNRGVQYIVRASGADGSSGNYQLSFSIAVDVFAERTPRVIRLDLSGTSTQSGSIDIPGDVDRFEFKALADGYMVVAMYPETGTILQGLVEFPSKPIVLQAFADFGWQGATRAHLVAIEVEKEQIYEFLVSDDSNTIGKYKLILTTYSPGTSVTFKTTREDFVGHNGAFRSLTFLLDDPPALGITEDPGVAPVRQIGNPSPTNTRLAAFILPPANASPPSSTVPGDPSTGTNGQGAVFTLPSSNASATSSTVTSNSLIATLLTVADRDNSVRSNDSVVAVQRTSDLASTVLTALLVGVIAPASGGGDDTAPMIGGTVFEDLDGDGCLNADEPGVAGEKIVLEVQQGDQYVVVAMAITDAKGAYAFADVPAGDYRVRRIAPAGSGPDLTTQTSYTLKVWSNLKPRVLNFGKASKRGKTLDPRDHPCSCGAAEDVVHTPESAFGEEIDRLFQDWNEEAGALAFLDHRVPDGSQTDWWPGLLCLAPVAMLSIANGRREGWIRQLPVRMSDL